MKIVIDCRFWGLEHAGLGRYVSNLVRNLVEEDKKNLYLLLINKKKQKEIASLLPKAKLVVTGAKHYSLKEQFEIPSLLRKLKYDLIHFPHFNLPIFASFKKPIVLTIHDLIKDESRGLETTTRHPAIYLIKYLGYKTTVLHALFRAETIIVPSNWVKKELIKRYKTPEDKIMVIYEGVENKFKVQSSKFKAIEQNLKILRKYEIKKPYFIYVGSAYPHKNLKNLIFALKILNYRLPAKVNLTIVCSRDVFWQRLEKHIKQTGMVDQVNLVGFVPDDDLKVLYRQSVAFMTSSLMEGFGLPGIEAMASGCPVVSSDKAALPEIYGQAAFYFDADNLEDIKDKMEKTLKLSINGRKEIIQKGLKQIANYDWKKCAKQTLKIYEKTAARFSLR